VVAAYQQKAVFLRDIAEVTDGPEEPAQYVFFGAGPAAHTKHIPALAQSSATFPAVTLSVAKRKGTNAVTVAEAVLEQVQARQGTLIPNDVQ
jgi:multidrug efflux pump subunit AcrB